MMRVSNSKRRVRQRRDLWFFSAMSAVVLAGLTQCFVMTSPFADSSSYAIVLPLTSMINSNIAPVVLDHDHDHDHDEAKVVANLKNNDNSIMLRNQTIVYIHVGKTGGTTLDSVLRSNCDWYSNIAQQNICHGALDDQEDQQQQQQQQQDEHNHSSITTTTMISKSTKATLHMLPKDAFHEWIEESTAFLVTIRNPIARAVSAFNMQHPNNTEIWHPNKSSRSKQQQQKQQRRSHLLAPDILPLRKEFYQDCFPTVEHLAQSMILVQQQEQQQQQDDCYRSGWNILNGKDNEDDNDDRHRNNIFITPQLQYNYAYYHNMTSHRYPERPILALRTEHLWEDLKHVDRLLGGSGDFPQSDNAPRHTWGSERYPVQGGLSSPAHVHTFCCVLASELQIYETLLLRAVNLSPSDKEATRTQLYDQCGLLNDTTISAAAAAAAAAADNMRNGEMEQQHWPFPWVEWAQRTESRCPPPPPPVVHTSTGRRRTMSLQYYTTLS